MLTPRTKQKLQAMINDMIIGINEDFPEITTVEHLKEAHQFTLNTLKGDFNLAVAQFTPPDDNDWLHLSKIVYWKPKVNLNTTT